MQIRPVLRSALFALSIAFAVRTTAAAQTPVPGRVVPSGGEITGKLVDSASGRAVTGGSVTVRRAGDSTFASGALPKEDGSFRVDGLAPGRYTLRARAIGFAPFVRGDIVISPTAPSVNLGTVNLRVVATKLDAAQVTAEREDVVLAPDRTSYNVKNMPVATGGTAIDVLRNIPLVEVDGSNNVSLRGNANVVVQINGRSTPLKGDQLGIFLAQLPAGTVKNVEVATNPSAKDDPEGTAGIINIILNQEATLGLSGGFNGSASSTGGLNGGGNIGQQRGKLILFGSANIYHDSRNTSGTISRTNLVIPVPAFSETRLAGNQTPLSGGGTLRSEYRFTDRTSLSFDGWFFGGHFGGDNSSAYQDLAADRSVIGAFNQFQAQTSRNASQDYDFTLRHTGERNVPVLTMELEYATNEGHSDNNLSGTVTQADAATPPSIRTERDKTTGRNPYVNWKTDYTHTFSPTSKLETGFKFTGREAISDFDASYLNSSTGGYTSDPMRASGFKYREDIGGAYALLSNKVGNVQSQAGVRLEDAATYFDLPHVDERFDRRYSSAYPSAILSYNFTPTRSARLSYSRRVSRPNPYQLSPVEFRQDSRNVFRGNPELRAEYTNALEMGFQESRSWGSIQLGPYLRTTDHAVRNIQFVDSSGVSVSTFANVASVRQIGADLNVNAHHGPLQVGGGGSVYQYKSDAGSLGNIFSVNSAIWSARSNATWIFSKQQDAQAYLFYRAPAKTEGGSQLASIGMNFGYRYKVWGDKGNISVRVSDPFKLQKFGYRLANGSVIEYSERFFGSRAVFIGISRNFGQALKLTQKQQDPDAIPPAGAGGPPP
jgi:ferric enterobactin receptor